jgi:DNA-binding transcriptional LysR family regulator
VVEEVREGHAELGLISFPRKWADLAVIPWRDEPMILATHPEHPLARPGSAPIRALDGLKLVGFDPELAIRRAIDRFLRQHGVQVETVLEFDNIENIKRAVEVPGGAAILPEPTLNREIAAGTIAAVPFSDARLVRPLAIVHRRGGDLGLTASRFLELLIGDDPTAALASMPTPAPTLAAASASTVSTAATASKRVAVGEPS